MLKLVICHVVVHVMSHSLHDGEGGDVPQSDGECYSRDVPQPGGNVNKQVFCTVVLLLYHTFSYFCYDLHIICNRSRRLKISTHIVEIGRVTEVIPCTSRIIGMLRQLGRRVGRKE